MEMYQHDSARMFRFVLRGELSGSAVTDLEQAWRTSASILKHKELVVDVSEVVNADATGLDCCLACGSQGPA